MGAITADQLGIVLKSIEEKYAVLRDENSRLSDRLDEQRVEHAQLLEKLARQQSEIERLEQALQQAMSPSSASSEELEEPPRV